jgi:hypothetical protein
VIQSLPIETFNGIEKIQTGEKLYDDLLKWEEYKCKDQELRVILRKIQSKDEWNSLMNEILADCKNNGNIPLLHIEVHGAKTDEVFTQGYVLGNGELIDIETIGCQLRAINIATKCNLFITLAVCKGMSLLLNMHVNMPMPFIGVVGSFYEIYETDIYVRYTEFYTELFKSFDIAKAYIALKNANPDMNADYRWILADELFYRNYQRYLDEQCTPQALKKRAEESSGLSQNPPRNRREKRDFAKRFMELESKNRTKYYKEAVNEFFLLNEFSDNEKRFNVPSNFNELKERCKHLGTV